MTLTVSAFVKLCAFADKSEETFTGLLVDWALTRSPTMMPGKKHRETSREMHASLAMVGLSLMLFIYYLVLSSLLTHNEEAMTALFAGRESGGNLISSFTKSHPG